MQIDKKNVAEAACILFGLLTSAYVVVRAATLSLVHDESLTYLRFVYPGVPLSDVMAFSGDFASNNHLLNSFLMRLSSRVFGVSEFALRLPNVIAYMAYLVSSFFLVKRFRSAVTALSLFVLLNANPFILDFFGLARGYGLALGFLLISILFFWKYFENDAPRFRDRFLPFFFAALSVLSSFTFLNFYLGLLATLIFVQALRGRKARKPVVQELWPGLSVTVLLFVTVLPILLKLNTTGGLYEGGTTGFFADTITILVRNSLYSEHAVATGEQTLSYVVVFLFLSSVGAVVWLSHQNGFILSRTVLSGGFLVVFVTLIAVMSSIALHYLLNVKFLMGRTAILFIPLFVLCLPVLFDDLLRLFPAKSIQRSVGSGILVALAAGAIMNFASHANFSYALIWKYDAETRDFTDDLIKFRERQISLDPRLSNRRMNFRPPDLEEKELIPIRRNGVRTRIHPGTSAG